MATTLGFAPQQAQFPTYEDYLKQQGNLKIPSTQQPPAPTQQAAGSITVPQGVQQPTLPYDPNKTSGESYNPQTGKWEFVPEGGTPQMVYWGPTDTMYYNGQPITKAQYQQLQQGGPTAVGAPFSQGTINTNLGNLGLGQKPAPVTAPTITPTSVTPTSFTPSAPVSFSGSAQGVTPSAAGVAAPPKITAPTVQAAQGGFDDFNTLQREIFESTYRPAEREINLQRGEADERLQSALAQAGISSSGSGIGQRVRQDQEYSRQLAAAAQDASHQAAVQRYGMEYAQSMDNAKLRQEANLANAGFSLTTQVENAKYLLTANITTAQLQTQASIAGAQNQTQAGIANTQAGAQIAAANIGAQSAQAIANAQIQSAQALAQAQIASQQAIASAQMQVQTMGLSLEAEAAARRDYLTLLGIQEADLARMDDTSIRTLALFYDTYLKELSIVGQVGSASFSKDDSSASSFGFDSGIELGIGGKPGIST